MSRRTVWNGAMIVCSAIMAISLLQGISRVIGYAGYSYDHSERYTAGDAEIKGNIRNLDVEWVSGEVNIAYHAEKTVLLNEKANRNISKDMQMRWWLDGETLRVRYAKSNFNLDRKQQKELTITLPKEISLEDVSISATSGDLKIPSLQAENLTLQVTSGEIEASAAVENVTCGAISGDIELNVTAPAKEITLGTTSGDITVSAEDADRLRATATSGKIEAEVDDAKVFHVGTTSGKIRAEAGLLEKAEFSSTSGDIRVEAEKFETLVIGTTSGKVSVSLPEETGFTARMDTVSGEIRYDLPLAKKGSSFVCGDGSGKLDIDTTSGDISIKVK